MGLEDRRGDNGTTLVEFAMVAPLLLILIFGIVEFARAASELTAVRTAAREGARFATTVGDDLDDPHYVDCEAIFAAAREKAVIGSLQQITVEWEGGYKCSDPAAGDDTGPPAAEDLITGTEVTVTVSTEFDSVVPLVETFLDGAELESRQTRQVFKGLVEDTG